MRRAGSTHQLRFALGALALALFLLAPGCGSGGGSGAPVSLPDLVISEVSGTPRNPVDSGTVIPYSISVTLRNKGSIITTPFRVGLYISNDKVIDPGSDTFVDSRVLPAMMPSEEVILDFVGDFPPLTPGNLRVGAFADDDPGAGTGGSVAEHDERNNAGLDPEPLDVFFSNPPPPPNFLGEDTLLFTGVVWVREGAIRLTWEAVPGASGYNLYRHISPITPVNPGTLVNTGGLIPGSSLGPGFNIHGYIDGRTLTNVGDTLYPTNDEPNLAPGIYHYKVFTVDGIGTTSLDGTALIANHGQAGTTPEDIFRGSPGAAPPGAQPIVDLQPTFDWDALSMQLDWTWSIAVGEPVPGVDPVWIYHGFAQGQSGVTLPYGSVGAFTVKDALPLQSGTVYTWFVTAHDTDGWAVLQGRPLNILTP